MPETALARLAAHLPCLERAAADETASAEVRSVVAAMVVMTRTALETAGQGRTSPDAAGISRKVQDAAGSSRMPVGGNLD